MGYTYVEPKVRHRHRLNRLTLGSANRYRKRIVDVELATYHGYFVDGVDQRLRVSVMGTNCVLNLNESQIDELVRALELGKMSLTTYRQLPPPIKLTKEEHVAQSEEQQIAAKIAAFEQGLLTPSVEGS